MEDVSSDHIRNISPGEIAALVEGIEEDNCGMVMIIDL
jgi:hypothetical protein